MSRTVDERIVQMALDNSNFERNAKQSIDTLDRLSYGIETFTNAASNTIKKSNLTTVFRGLADSAKSSAEQSLAHVEQMFQKMLSLSGKIMAKIKDKIATGLVDGANNAIRWYTGHFGQLAAARSGFTEFETKLDSIQSILMNVEDEGKGLREVSYALDELNKYADDTVYNFAQMTQAIGTFTAAGVNLDESVAAIKGLSNVAAGLGVSNERLVSAERQIAQSLQIGYLTLGDWNSMVNAGLGGEYMQKSLLETAKEYYETIGDSSNLELVKKIQNGGASLRDSLKDGVINAKILVKTFNKFAADESLLKAATEVRTFTKLVDALGEAIGSGWAKTWEIIVGDMEHGKKLWTGINDVVAAYFDRISEGRNRILGDFLGTNIAGFVIDDGTVAMGNKNWYNLVDIIVDACRIVTDAVEGVKTRLKRLFIPEAGSESYYKLLFKLSTKIQSIRDTLKEVGDDLDKFREGKVSKFGEWMRYPLKMAEQISYVVQFIWGLLKIVAKGFNGVFKPLTDIIKWGIASVTNFFGILAEKTKPFQEFLIITAVALSRIAGMFVDFLTNLSDSIMQFSVVGVAGIFDWFDTLREKMDFVPWEKIDEFLNKIYEDIIKFAYGIPIEEDQDNFIVKFINTITSSMGKVKAWFNEVKPVLEHIFIKIVEAGVHAYPVLKKLFDIAWYSIKKIGSSLSGFKGSISAIVRIAVQLFRIGMDIVNKLLGNRGDKIKSGVDAAGDSLYSFGQKVSYWLNKVADFLEKADSDTIYNMIVGFVNAVKNKIKDLLSFIPWDKINAHLVTFKKTVNNTVGDGSLLDKIKNLGNIIFGFFKDFKSKVAANGGGLGGFIKTLFDEISDGIRSGISGIIKVVQTSLEPIMPAIKWVRDQFNTILDDISNDPLDFIKRAASAFLAVKALAAFYSLINAPGTISEAIAEMIEKLGGVFKSVSGFIDEAKKNLKVAAFKGIITGVLMIIGAIIVLSLMPKDKIEIGFKILLTIFIGISALMLILTKMTDSEKATSAIKAIGKFFLFTGIALALIVSSIKKVAKLDEKSYSRGLGFLITVFGMFAIMGKIATKADEWQGSDATKMGKMMIQMAFAINLLMLPLIELTMLGAIAPKALTKGITAMGAMLAILALVGKLASTSPLMSDKEIGRNLIKIALALNLLILPLVILTAAVGAVTLVTGNANALLIALGSIIVVTGFLYLIVEKLKDLNGKAQKQGTSIHELAKAFMSIALSLVVVAIALNIVTLACGDPGRIAIGGTVMAAMLAVMAGVLWVMSHTMVTKGGDTRIKESVALVNLAKMFVTLALSLVIIAVALKLIGAIEPDNLAAAGTVLMAMMVVIGVIIGMFLSANKKGEGGLNPSTFLTMAVLMVTISIAIGVIVAAIGYIALLYRTLQWDAIVVALITIFTVIGAIIGILKLATKFAVSTVGLAKFSAILLETAVSLALISAAALGFSVAMDLITGALPALTLMLVPFTKQLGLAIVKLCQILADGRDDIIEGVRAVIDAIGIGLLAGIVDVLKWIGDNGQTIVSALTGSIGVIIVGFLVGVGALIGAAAGGLVAGAFQAIISAFQALLVKDEETGTTLIEDLIDVVVQIISEVIGGTGRALKKNAVKIATDCYDFVAGVLAVLDELLKMIGVDLKSFGDFIWEEWIKKGLMTFGDISDPEEFEEVMTLMCGDIQTAVENALRDLPSLPKLLWDNWINLHKNAWDELREGVKQIVGDFVDMISLKPDLRYPGVVTEEAQGSGGRGYDKLAADVLSNVTNVTSKLTASVQKEATKMGESLPAGMLSGVTSTIKESTDKMADTTLKSIKKSFKIASPPKDEYALMKYSGETLPVAIDEGYEENIDEATENMAVNTEKAFENYLVPTTNNIRTNIAGATNEVFGGLEKELGKNMDGVSDLAEEETESTLDNIINIVKDSNLTKRITGSIGNPIDAMKESILGGNSGNFTDGIKEWLGLDGIKDSMSDMFSGFDTSSFMPDMSSMMSGIDMSSISNNLSGLDLDKTATITPVLDEKSYASINDGAMERFESLEMLTKMMNEYNNDNTDVIKQLLAMRGDIMSLSASMLKMRVVMDTGATVGAMESEMDRRLGLRQSLRMRGVN